MRGAQGGAEPPSSKKGLLCEKNFANVDIQKGIMAGKLRMLFTERIVSGILARAKSTAQQSVQRIGFGRGLNFVLVKFTGTCGRCWMYKTPTANANRSAALGKIEGCRFPSFCGRLSFSATNR